MKITRSFFTKICCNQLIIIFVLLMLSACNAREDQLSAREARISTRESELVTLFAELVEQRKSLEKDPSDNSGNTKDNSDADKDSTCPCGTNSGEISQKKQSAKTES